jgi:hypothetical protein
MDCQLVATSEPATDAGVLYRCEVCGRGYRSHASPDRISRVCVATPEQWHAVRLASAEQSLVAIYGDTEALRAEVLPRAERCISCRHSQGSACAVYGCTRKWAGRLVSGECRRWAAK